MNYCSDRFFVLAHNAYKRTIATLTDGTATATSFNRRAAAYGCDGVLAPHDVSAMRREAKACYWCNTKFTSQITVTLDHVWPLRAKGPNVVENLVPSCRICNSRKRDSNPLEFARVIGRDVRDIEVLSTHLFSTVGGSLEQQIAFMQKVVVHYQFNRRVNVHLFLVRTYREFIEAGLQVAFEKHSDFIARNKRGRFSALVLEKGRSVARAVLSTLNMNQRVIQWPEFV